MEYISLHKLFFKDPKNFEQIYLSRLHNENSIRFDFTIDKYPIFYMPTSHMLSLVNDIQQYNAKLIEIVSNKMPGIALAGFIKQTLVDEIKMTNDIEGVLSTKQEISAILEDVNKSKGKRLSGIIAKYSKILEDSNKAITSCKDLRRLYDEILLLDVKKEDINNVPDGKYFRKEGVDIYNHGNIVHHGIFPEEKIIEKMEKALHILNNEELPLLIRVAIFHYLLGYIHPFYDGNGRINRLLSSYYLKQEVHVLCALQIAISCGIKQNTYSDSFVLCNDIRNRGDLTPFILSFLQIYKEGLEQLVARVFKKLEQYEYYCTALKQDVSYPQEVIETIGYFVQTSLFTQEGLSLKRLMKIMKCSEPTVRKRVQELLQSDFKEAIIYIENKKPIVYQLDLTLLDKVLKKIHRIV